MAEPSVPETARAEMLAKADALHRDARAYWGRGNHAAGNLLFGKTLGILDTLYWLGEVGRG